ncbi:hypothetical protein C9374_009284 [Naegleria lovaniensis]|uniref:Uncharacterized protein n=1 Tax=Naegleria lovaniensis TaxID=51637 RepID=A0AA88GF69_NAELO|nr:uncharacterized protein C9374_009284 [Naegleria lovaniensis]KAG2377373.1 hypothetical protein C9374_009284 [Naegleria lovaniensis]
MFPHIYHGYIPNAQKPIIKAKIDHYGYCREMNINTASCSDGVLGETRRSGLKSFDPRNNTANMTLTMDHVRNRTHKSRVENLMQNFDSVAIATSRSIETKQQSIMPNSNMFIRKNLSDTTSGDFKKHQTSDFPSHVTAQQVEYRKGPEQAHQPFTRREQRSHSSHANVKKPCDYTTKHHLVKSIVSEDFKVSTIIKCPKGKMEHASSVTTYPVPEGSSQVIPSSYSIDYNSNGKELISSTIDIEGIHKDNKKFRTQGYSGHVPDENNHTLYGRPYTTPSVVTNKDHAKQSLYLNNDSTRPMKGQTFLSTNYGSDHIPGYMGYVERTVYDPSKVEKSCRQDHNLVKTILTTSEVAHPNITKATFMKNWQSDSQLQHLYGQLKDKSNFRQNAMVNEFFSHQCGEFMPSSDGKTNAEMFYSSNKRF